jgi:hypothetical protein
MLVHRLNKDPQMTVVVLLAVSPALIGVAVVLAMLRAKKDDLPDIVRALMRMGPRGDGPPSLPRL